MNRKMLIVGIAGFAGGALAGSLITYYVTYKKLEAMARLAIDEEVENRSEAARVFYKEKYERAAQENKVGDYKTPSAAVEKLGRKAVAAVLGDDEEVPPPTNGHVVTDYRKFSKPLTNTDDDSRADPVIREVPPAQRRPRDEHGRFTSSKPDTMPEDDGVVTKISQDDYSANYFEYEQLQLTWFHEHGVLMDPETEEEVDVEVVGGEEMMQSFDFSIPEGEKNEICVRNTRLEREYVISLSVEDLNEAMDALQD